MKKIISKIRQINDYYVGDNLSDAYKCLYELTCDNPLCGECNEAAKNILHEYNQLEDDIINMRFDLTLQGQKKREIKTAFLKLISKVERQFKPEKKDEPICEDESVLEEEKAKMKEHHEKLNKSLTTVLYQIIDCDVPEKTHLLERIKEKLQKTIEYLFDLMKRFKEVCQYE